MINIFYFFICLIFIGLIFPLISIVNLYNCTKKDIIFYANQLLKNWLNFNIYIISKNNLIINKNVIYLSNHVSFSDFLFDSFITNYSSKFISRYNIVIFFPLFFLISKITDCVIFFKKNNITNINSFFKWIDIIRKSDNYNNILVYPEGLRRPNALEPCELKKGFIYYSYDYDIPIQIINSYNKESVIQEKILSVQFNQSIFVYYSKEINPIDLKKKNYTREEYFDYVNKYWIKIWFKVRNNSNVNKYLLNNNLLLINKYPIVQNKIHNNNNILPIWFLLSRIIFYFLIIYYLFL